MRRKIAVVLVLLFVAVGIPLAQGQVPPVSMFSFTGYNSLTESRTGRVIATNSLVAGKFAEIVRLMEAAQHTADNPWLVIQSGVVAEQLDWGIMDRDITVDELRVRESAARITLRVGQVSYNIIIPPGTQRVLVGASEERRNINEPLIRFAVTNLNAIRNAILRGILAGSMANSYSVYTAYSNEQLPVGHQGEGGLLVADPAGGFVLGGVGSNRVVYSLDYFISPLFGRLEKGAFPRVDADWEAVKLPTIQLGVTDLVSGAVQVILHPDYRLFLRGITDGSLQLRNITRMTAAQAAETAIYANRRSRQVADYRMRVLAPSIFTNLGGRTYALLDGGFSLIDGVRISLHTKDVYKLVDGVYQKTGSIYDLGIDGNDLVLHKHVVNGNTVGAVILLEYREVIVDTSKEASPRGLFFTGRVVNFSNNYSGALHFDRRNTNMMDISAPVGGTGGVYAKEFAFDVGSTVTPWDIKYHALLSGNPVPSFRFFFGFESDLSGVPRLVIYRNNTFVGDVSLIHWLRTPQAQSLTTINALELLNRLLGVFDVVGGELTFGQWLRIQEIRDELSRGRESFFARAIRLSSFAIGVLLVIYSVSLLFAYFIDIFNIVANLSILNMMTFGKLYPITSFGEIDYIQRDGAAYKYITKIGVLRLTLFGCLVGVLFMHPAVLLRFLLSIFMFLTNLFGGV